MEREKECGRADWTCPSLDSPWKFISILSEFSSVVMPCYASSSGLVNNPPKSWKHHPSKYSLYMDIISSECKKVTFKIPRTRNSMYQIQAIVAVEQQQKSFYMTCHKSQFMPEFTEKMPRPRWISRPRPTLCASLRSRNADMSQEQCHARI